MKDFDRAATAHAVGKLQGGQQRDMFQ